MKQYHDLVNHILSNGVEKADRTGTGTISIFGYQARFNLSEGFPLLTTKKLHIKSIIHELLWFLKGDTNIRYLKENGVSIWDEWVKPGTEEYVDLSVDEIKKELIKRLNATEFYDRESKELAGTSEYRLHRDEDNPSRVVFEYGSNESWARAFEDICGHPAKKLIAGELGPVYGAQWRNWPVADQNIIDGLIKLACLGNGEKWGNSEGNEIAQRTLMDIPGIQHNERAYKSSGMLYSEWLIRTSKHRGNFSTEGGVDQIQNLIFDLKKSPDSRRLIVSAWNPVVVDRMSLPPCHALYQFYSEPMSFKDRLALLTADQVDQFTDHVIAVRGHFGEMVELTDEIMEQHQIFLDGLGIPKRRLSCQLYQRSADVGLGVPFNWASYALLTMMVAQVVGMVPGDFVWTGGDVHIYKNHIEQLKEQVTREPYQLPRMKINPAVKDIFKFKYEDFELVDYQAHPHIKMDVSV